MFKKLDQTWWREEVLSSEYCIEMWIRDWKAESMFSTRFVVRNKMPS